MSRLAERVSIDRRFARSARVDADLGGSPPLKGYVLQASVAKALSTMATSQAEGRQGAFTWTGPYGGGKSSAALLVASLVGGADEQRAVARGIAGENLVNVFTDAFPPETGRWAVVAVTGRRTGLRDAIAEAAAVTFGWRAEAAVAATETDRALIGALLAGAGPGGTLLVIDELGKLLEHEAATGGDAHLLQDLAERASRSDGKLVVIGILHQSFEQYAERAHRDVRREWAKVQGRYQDIPFLAGTDETVALLGRAISSRAPARAAARAVVAAEAVARRRPADASALAGLLTATWPLNPVTALLLGPVSRQRFAQNERSVFGFLASAEPAGFQEFLATETAADPSYDPPLLWDYLAANFGMALAGGQDGGRFSLAFEAIERAGARGGPLHVALTKSAAVIEFFRNGSGVAVADDFLALSVPGADPGELKAAIADLLDWAVLIRQPRLGGYALFAGSDFDLEEAISRASAPLSAEELAGIPERVGLGAVSAKRHYFETGTLRTFDVAVAVVGEDDDETAVVERVAMRPARGGGSLVLLLGDGGMSGPQLDGRARRTAAALAARGAVAAVGSTARSFSLRSGAEEVFAMERVLRDHPQLEGDRIARREISARMSAATEGLRQIMEDALEDAKWRPSTDPGTPSRDRLTVIASTLATAAYPDAPVIRSELLQRDRPSSSAMAALRELCRAMVARADHPELGIEGYPAERGLYLSVLRPLGLHGDTSGGEPGFQPPPPQGTGASLAAAWRVLDACDGTLADAFATWRKPPFGMRAGIMPVLALAYILANKSNVAVYVDEAFQPDIDDLTVDRLLQKPAALRLRKLDRTVQQAAFLAGLADRLGLLAASPALPVAQALFRRFAKLPPHTKRSTALPQEAIAIRDAVVRSNDPEELLFTALPDATGHVGDPSRVMAALETCEAYYPSLLADIRRALARALGADAADFHGVAARAETIRNLTNDFAFEAFCARAAAFDGGGGDVEGLASLLVHKPAHSWSDRDRSQALLELARLGRRFREAEALASVRDRRSSSEALALVVGIDPSLPPLLSTFELTEEEKATATALADDLLARLAARGPTTHMRLAALARAVASVAGEAEAA